MTAKAKPLVLVACACGCGGKLSYDDAARERWLSDIAGEPGGGHIASAPPPAMQHVSPPEPTTVLRCSCGDAVELAVYLADFLARWGTGRPRCANCNARRIERANDERARRTA